MNVNVAPTGPISRLVLENVRCFEQLDLDMSPGVTVLLGDNGSGKTTVIEAIASLCGGDDEGLDHFPLRNGASSGTIEVMDPAGQPSAVWRSEHPSFRQRLPDSWQLFAYGRYRRVPPPPPPKSGRSRIALGPEWDEYAYPSEWSDLASAVHHRRTASLFRPDNYLLADLRRFLLEVHKLRSFMPSMQLAWERLEWSLRELGQGFESLEVAWDEAQRREVAFVRRHGLKLDLRELSDGYQCVLVIIFDLILRYALLFPGLRDPLDGRATVLIDEIDLHLHPRWQRDVLRQLTTLFPSTQLVVTTHSPAVVQSAIDDGHPVVLLESNAGRAKARPLSKRAAKGLRQAEVGALWNHRRLFGVSRHSEKVGEIEADVDRLTRKLDRGRATADDRAKLISRFDELREIQVADDERRGTGGLLSQLSKTQLAYLRRLEEKLAATESGP